MTFEEFNVILKYRWGSRLHPLAFLSTFYKEKETTQNHYKDRDNNQQHPSQTVQPMRRKCTLHNYVYEETMLIKTQGHRFKQYIVNAITISVNNPSPTQQCWFRCNAHYTSLFMSCCTLRLTKLELIKGRGWFKTLQTDLGHSSEVLSSDGCRFLFKRFRFRFFGQSV